jgi:general secretion pathway protein I
MWRRDEPQCGVASAECGVKSPRTKSDTASWTFIPYPALRTSNLKGFTLLEVMVAVAILGMVLVTLLGVKNRSMQDVVLADRITTATLLAKSKMIETLATTVTNTVFEDEGEFPEEEFKDYTWKQSISKIEPLVNVKITEVRVAVLWKEGERQEMVELKSYE